MPISNKNIRLMITVSEEIAVKVRRQAQKENRTVSNMVQTILLDYYRKKEIKMLDSYCPICAENLGDAPVCSSCGDVSGSSTEEYRLHSKEYYIQKQQEMFGKIVVEPKL